MLLEVRDLKTYFNTKAGLIKAVDGVSWEVSEGEALGIVGESGCGKSVSALSIMRLIPQPSGRIAGGEILFEGRDLLGLDDQEMRNLRGNQIAMIFQDAMASLNPVLTIKRQMTEGLRRHLNMNSKEARNRAIEMIEMVGIPSAAKRIDDYPHHFSGGMRQRVMIAMALACNPKIIIADEPTTALDVTVQAQIIDLINELRRELGTAIIWITHDLGVVAGLCDRAVVMYAGHVAESASVIDLYANPSHPYTLGLLKSIPRLDDPPKAKLTPIDGVPPDLLEPPDACDFLSRCVFATGRCQQKRPTLRAVGHDHKAACWVDDIGS